MPAEVRIDVRAQQRHAFGERADGSAALSAMYSEYFAGMLHGTTTSVELTNIRPVESQHALADADQTVYSPTGEVILALHVVNLLRREGDGWRLVDSRPYRFSSPAGHEDPLEPDSIAQRDPST